MKLYYIMRQNVVTQNLHRKREGEGKGGNLSDDFVNYTWALFLASYKNMRVLDSSGHKYYPKFPSTRTSEFSNSWGKSAICKDLLENA